MGVQLKDAFGSNGYRELTSASGTSTEDFYAVKAVDGLSANVDIVNKVGDDSTGITILAGDILYINSTSLTVNSGTVHAYKRGR